METQLLYIILVIGTAVLNWDIISGNENSIQKKD
jgi:hypothetical protein